MGFPLLSVHRLVYTKPIISLSLQNMLSTVQPTPRGENLLTIAEHQMSTEGARSRQSRQEPATYTLLDDTCVPQETFRLEVAQWPSATNNTGSVVMFTGTGNRDELEFTFAHDTRTFKTYHVLAPCHYFKIEPIIEDSVIVELRVDLGDNEIGRFVLFPEDYADQHDTELSIPELMPRRLIPLVEI